MAITDKIAPYAFSPQRGSHDSKHSSTPCFRLRCRLYFYRSVGLHALLKRMFCPHIRSRLFLRLLGGLHHVSMNNHGYSYTLPMSSITKCSLTCWSPKTVDGPAMPRYCYFYLHDGILPNPGGKSPCLVRHGSSLVVIGPASQASWALRSRHGWF